MRDFTVLIVDDVEENIYVILEILKGMQGTRLLTASTGEQALEKALKNEIDLILLDIQLPDINGYEIAEYLKSKNKTMDIPIVFVTAIFRNEEFVKRGYQLGAIDYLFKPLDDEILYKKVEFYKQQYIRRMDLEGNVRESNYQLQLRVNELMETRRKLEFFAYHDQLTELYNRRYFQENYDAIFREENYPISILMGDLVGLKVINDGFGHTLGDEMLVEVAKVLTKRVPNSVIFRWGGDEFLVCAFQRTEVEIAQVMNEIAEEFKGIKIDEKFSLDMSMGHSVIMSKEDSVEDAVKDAEDRMYVSKLRTDSIYKSSIIDTLHSSLQEKNFETEEHAERMKELVIRFSDVIDLSRYEVDQLVLLTSLHDIGKIAVRDAILSKPGPLNDKEWEEVKKHCEVGYRLCSTIPELAPISNVILSHHEKWDGTGYPQGLRGKEIPFLSRIISVVDSFDVMTNNRPYKKGMSKENAIKELKRCSGTQFDPFIVEKFIKMIQ